MSNNQTISKNTIMNFYLEHHEIIKNYFKSVDDIYLSLKSIITKTKSNADLGYPEHSARYEIMISRYFVEFYNKEINSNYYKDISLSVKDIYEIMSIFEKENARYERLMKLYQDDTLITHNMKPKNIIDSLLRKNNIDTYKGLVNSYCSGDIYNIPGIGPGIFKRKNKRFLEILELLYNV